MKMFSLVNMKLILVVVTITLSTTYADAGTFLVFFELLKGAFLTFNNHLEGLDEAEGIYLDWGVPFCYVA